MKEEVKEDELTSSKIDSLIVTNANIYLEANADTISPNIGLYRIGTVVNFPNPKANKSTRRRGATLEPRSAPRRPVGISESFPTVEDLVERAATANVRHPVTGERIVASDGRITNVAIPPSRLQQLEREREIELQRIARLRVDLNAIRTRRELTTDLRSREQWRRQEIDTNRAMLERTERAERLAIDIEREVNRDAHLNELRDLRNTWGTTSVDSWEEATVYKVQEVITEKEELTIPQKKQRLFDSFAANYGGLPAIIKGYILQGKVYTNNKAIQEVSSYTPTSKDIKIILKVYSIEEGVITTKVVCVKGSVMPINKTFYSILPALFKLKIKSSTDSSNVFGLAKERKAFEGTYPEYWEIKSASPKKLGRSTLTVSITNDKGKEVKFLFSDCEFINPELSSYTPPIDRTIKINSTVKIIEKSLSKYGVNQNEEGIVLGIKSNPSSKRISKRCRNRRMDIITVQLQSGRLVQVFAQDLKFIKTQQITQNDNSSKKESYSKKRIEDYFTEERFQTWTISPFTTTTNI